MEYVIVRHGQMTGGEGDMSGEHVQRERGCASNASGRRGETRYDGVVQACMQNVRIGSQTNSEANEVGVRKRRSRRPTTSALSDKVWREMRRQIAGRAQDDGVT